MLNWVRRVPFCEVFHPDGAIRVPHRHLAIIVPYAGALADLKAMLATPEFAAIPGIADLIVGSIDALQGREARVVIIVMTATEAVGPGFTANKARFNVAVSRAIEVTLIVSDQHVARRVRYRNVHDNVEGGGAGDAEWHQGWHDVDFTTTNAGGNKGQREEVSDMRVDDEDIDPDPVEGDLEDVREDHDRNWGAKLIEELAESQAAHAREEFHRGVLARGHCPARSLHETVWPGP